METQARSALQVARQVIDVLAGKEAARAIAEWPRWLPTVAQSGHPFVCFGGQAYVEHPQLIERTAGEYLGDTLEGGVQKMDTKLHDLFPSVL